MPESSHEQLFRDAFHFAAVGMALVGLDGRWLRVNQSLCEILGYPEEELLAVTFQEITHPDDLDDDLSQVDMLLEGSTTSYKMEKRYRHRQGHTIWALLHVSLVRDEEGVPEVFISQVTDITARKTAELELARTHAENQRLLERLLESQRKTELLRSQLLKVCAWTKRIYYEDRWISMDEFLSEHLELQLTHGISDEALQKALAEMTPDDLPPFGPG